MFSNLKAQFWMFYEDPYIVLSKSKFSYPVVVLGLNKSVIPLKAHTDFDLEMAIEKRYGMGVGTQGAKIIHEDKCYSGYFKYGVTSRKLS